MKYLCIALIRFYRKFLSKLKRNPTCRFTPTCSAYALEAYQKRGFFAGTILTVWRILRCNPYCAGGYDPVPERGFRNREKNDGVSIAYSDAGNDYENSYEDSCGSTCKSCCGNSSDNDFSATDGMSDGDRKTSTIKEEISAEAPWESERKTK